MNLCKDCEGRGYNLSDGKQLICGACDGWGEIIDEDELTDEAIELMGRKPKIEPDEDDLRDEERERR